MGTDYNKMGENNDSAPRPRPPAPRPGNRPQQRIEKPGPVPAKMTPAEPKQEEVRQPKPEIPASVRRDQLREEVQKQGKRSKEEKESEFVSNVEMLLGGPLYQWQKELLLQTRRASLEGREFKLTTEYIRQHRGF